MTLRQLLLLLFHGVDDDVLDCEVWLVIHQNLAMNTKIMVRGNLTEIPEGYDVEDNRFYLISRE
jgi:hypothetical protein